MGVHTDHDDDGLIDRLQRGAFSYIEKYVNPQNGLVADTSRNGSPCSIAVVGFALSCYPIAVENGWMTREAAAALTLTTLRFLRPGRKASGRTQPASRGSTIISST